MAERREIENREAPESEREAGVRIDPHAAVVRAAMGDGRNHPPRVIGEIRRP
jgi:hypothetical protein